VARENQQKCVDETARRRVLRRGVLDLGAMLGFDRRQVIQVAEVVTGSSWRRCQCADFERILDEYSAMVGRVMARQRSAAEHEIERHTHALAA